MILFFIINGKPSAIELSINKNEISNLKDPVKYDKTIVVILVPKYRHFLFQNICRIIFILPIYCKNIDT